MQVPSLSRGCEMAPFFCSPYLQAVLKGVAPSRVKGRRSCVGTVYDFHRPCLSKSQYGDTMNFSRAWVHYLGYESLKSDSKTRSGRLVQPSKIFVWGQKIDVTSEPNHCLLCLSMFLSTFFTPTLTEGWKCDLFGSPQCVHVEITRWWNQEKPC